MKFSSYIGLFLFYVADACEEMEQNVFLHNCFVLWERVVYN